MLNVRIIFHCIKNVLVRVNINIVVPVPDIAVEVVRYAMENTPSVIAPHITVGMAVLVRMFTVMCARVGIVNPVPV